MVNDKDYIRYVIKDEEQMAFFLEQFNASSFAFDTETTDLRQDKLQLEGISLCDGNVAAWIPYHAWVKPWLNDIFLKDPQGVKIAHNIVFDMRVLHKYGVSFPDAKIYDTMVASHLIDENSPNGLKDLAERVLGHKETMSYEDAHRKGGQTFIDYATNDAIWTWELCQKQQPLLVKDGLGKLFRNIEMPFQFVLLEMALTGVYIDKAKRDSIHNQLVNDIEQAHLELHHVLGLRYEMQIDLFNNATIVTRTNFNSAQQVGDIMFNKLGLKVIETTPTGQPSIGPKTLDTYKDVPFVQTYSKYKRMQKLMSAFIGPMPDFIQDDGRIRANFNDIGAKTGRLSSSNPNLQQLPKASIDSYGVRACFAVPQGKKMIACDYSGQEVRVMAQVSKDPTLVDALHKGQDMHLKVANQFYNLGIPDECLFEHHPEYESYKKKFKDERTQAKVITFGLAYGKEAYGFSQDFGISEDEAQRLIDKYFEGMPNMHEAIRKAHTDVKNNGYVTTLAGRKRRFSKQYDPSVDVSDRGPRDGWYPKSALRQSFNFLIQGFSADMMRKAMVLVQRDRKPEWGLKTIMTIHDEAVYEVKAEYAEEAAQYIKGQFESTVKFCIPVVADVDIGDNYAQAK